MRRVSPHEPFLDVALTMRALLQISYNTRRIADKKFMQQGLINNTTAKGMKHFKNQSLNF